MSKNTYHVMTIRLPALHLLLKSNALFENTEIVTIVGEDSNLHVWELSSYLEEPAAIHTI